MVLVYIVTTLITATWITRMVIAKKFIFRRTILDIPILVFILSQVISTIFSIDPSTSFFGYYSRFNGGLLSTFCYTILYWAFVANLDRKMSLRTLYSLLTSATLVSIYGVLEHFGIDKNVWQQDVQSRVFSTLGQPNWLAAWVVALIPITWALIIKYKNKFEDKVKNNIKNNTKDKLKLVSLYALSALFFVTLLFTGSRSGILGFVVVAIIFWGLILLKYKKQYLKELIFCNLIVIVFSLLIGTQWTPSIWSLIKGPADSTKTVTLASGTVLETGGTESGSIRKIVWKGALEIWKHYPIFGSGVETFAYSYYLYRPIEHNLTSEWDFIYNKAHNEYLNFLANSGAIGLLSYLFLIGAIVYLFFKKLRTPVENSERPEQTDIIQLALLAGFSSILVTNFFGFSVVPIQLQFFLFPAIAIALIDNDQELVVNSKALSGNQKTIIYIVLATAGYLIITICKYWYADYLYATGRSYNTLGKADVATKYLTQAIKISPKQSLFYGDSYGLASSYVNLALAFDKEKEATQVAQLSTAAIAEINKAVSLTPANINFKRVKFGIYIMLSGIDPNYLVDARDTLLTAIAQAPTDPKLYYNLALIYARTGQTEEAIKILRETIRLKANYKEARLAYAILLIGQKENVEAKTQLEYILNFIDPNDSLTKQTLESVK